MSDEIESNEAMDYLTAEAIGARADQKEAERAEAMREASADPSAFDPAAVLAEFAPQEDAEVAAVMEELGMTDGEIIPTLPGTGRSRGPSFDDYGVQQTIRQAIRRDRWHETVTAPEVTKAWALVIEAAGATEAALVEVSEIRGAAQRAEGEHLQAVRVAAAQGDPAPKRRPSKVGDLGEAEARALGQRDRLRSARAAYDSALTASGAREALQDQAYPAAAQAAVKALEAAQEAVATFVSVRAAAAAEAVKDQTRSSAPMASGFHSVEHQLRKVIGAVRAQADKPVSEPKVEGASRVERQAIASHGDVRSRWWLQRLEESEGWKVTQHMRGVSLPRPDVYTY